MSFEKTLGKGIFTTGRAALVMLWSVALVTACTPHDSQREQDSRASVAGHWIRAYEYCDFIYNQDIRCDALYTYDSFSKFSFDETWRAVDINTEGTITMFASITSPQATWMRPLGQIESVEGTRMRVRLLDSFYETEHMVLDHLSPFLNISLVDPTGGLTTVPYMKVSLRDANAFGNFCEKVDCKARAVSKISSQQNVKDELTKQ